MLRSPADINAHDQRAIFLMFLRLIAPRDSRRRSNIDVGRSHRTIVHSSTSSICQHVNLSAERFCGRLRYISRTFFRQDLRDYGHASGQETAVSLQNRSDARQLMMKMTMTD